MSDQEDFNLAGLDNKELVEQIQDDLYDGLNDEVYEGVEILLDRGIDANDVLGDALVGGMKVVGEDFRDGILFVPEVLKCAGAMKKGMSLLRPILANSAIDISLGAAFSTIGGIVMIALWGKYVIEPGFFAE